MSTAIKRPQLNADELHQLKWLLGSVLATLSAWTVFFMEIDSWVLPGLVTLAATLAIWRPAWPARVPRLVHVLAFPGIVGYVIFDWYMSREILPTFIRLDLLLILYRLIGFRRRRDDLQLIVLGLFMVVVAGVLTVSLAFAVQIVAFTACALGFLLTITLAETAGDPPAAAGGKGEPRWAAQVNWRDLLARIRAVTDWRVVVLGGGLFAGVVVLSGLLFLAIPRFELNNSLFIDRLINRQTRTGFSDEIKFGEVTEIQQDEGIALSVDVVDRTQVPSMPYWRMVVLDDYTRGGFRLSPELRSQLNRAASRTTRLRGTARFRRDTTDWTFYLEAGVSRYLPLMGNFNGLFFPEPQMVGLSDALRVVALRADPSKMTAYRVTGMEFSAVLPDADLALKRRAADPAALATGSALSLAEADRARLQAMATEITEGRRLTSPEFAVKASTWLGARHRYSLQSSLPAGAGDPVVRWLASDTPGHCELFAGSFVLLARQAGYAARLVTGFKGGTWNGYSNSYTVRNSDAHAWVELFDDQAGGWLRVDPTPGALTLDDGTGGDEGEAALQRIVDNSWSARLESLRIFWYRRIVNFDMNSQVELARTAKEAVEGTSRRMRDALEGFVASIKAWLARPWDSERIIGLGGLVAFAAAVIVAWRRLGRVWWQRWRSGHARTAGADPIRREAGRLLARLSLAGGGAVSSELRSELERLRYGPRSTWPHPQAVFRRVRVELRRSARK
ncbi:MAG TPA: DUF3488 and transglutaminase-like domain-containing protein [Opitutaceae bacterium]